MRKTPPLPVYVDYGFATGAVGSALLLARIRRGSAERLLRIPFALPAAAALGERLAGYIALHALVEALQSFGITIGTIAVPDLDLLDDLRERRSLPTELHLPYIHLACLLHAWPRMRLEPGSAEELAQAAGREVALRAA